MTDETLSMLDAAAGGRVIVFGSLPPGGRDLDLLVRPAEEASLAAALRDAGFEQLGVTWVRFRDCGVEVVDLVPAEAWNLPKDELDTLFDQAAPLEGRGSLHRPSAGHTLLILARLLGRRGLPAKRQPRLAAAAAESGAWSEARSRAAAWDVADRLERLATPASRTRLPARPRRGRVIAFSGLDGAGKSTQARHLAAALEALGHDVVIIWTPLASNAGLRALAAPVRLALRALRRAGLGGDVAHRSVEGGSLLAVPDAGDGGRAQTAVTRAWSTLVALANAAAQGRRAAPHLARGRIVIFDRYILDSFVHLRYLYGREHSYRAQEALVRLLSPHALRSYFLDAEPATVAARKPLQYDLAQLELQTDLYREQSARIGVRRVDGEQPPEDVCSEVARDVWLALAE